MKKTAKSSRKPAAKSAPVRRTPAKKAAPVRKAAQNPAPLGAVPLRTTARVFAQNQADLLGVKLSKPGLRKATDRVEKLFKAKGIGGSALKMAEPVLERGAVQPADLSAQRAQTEPEYRAMLERQRAGQAETLGHVAERRYADPPRANQTAGVTSAARRPLDQAISHLENALGQIYEATGALVSQLTPLLPQNFEVAPGNPPVTIDGNAAIPLTVASVATRLEGLASLVRNVRDALAL